VLESNQDNYSAWWLVLAVPILIGNRLSVGVYFMIDLGSNDICSALAG
jgi:hypothetical protein